MKEKPNYYKGSINKEALSSHKHGEGFLYLFDYMDDWELSGNDNVYKKVNSYNDLTEEDRVLWEEEAKEFYGQDFEKLNPREKQTLYDNERFIDKFGMDTYYKMPYYSERQNYYKYQIKRENQDLIKEVYKDDPRLEQFLNLPDEYQKRLFDEHVMPFTKEQSEELNSQIRVLEEINSQMKGTSSEITDALVLAFGEYIDSHTGGYKTDEPLKGREGNGEYFYKNENIPIFNNSVQGELKGRNISADFKLVEYLKNPQTNSRGAIYGDEVSEWGQQFNIGLNEVEKNYLAGNQIINDAKAEAWLEEKTEEYGERVERWNNLTREDKIALGEEILNAAVIPHKEVFGKEKQAIVNSVLDDDFKLYAAEEYIRADTSSLVGASIEAHARMMGDIADFRIQEAIAEDEGFFETAGKGLSQFFNGLAADIALDFNIIYEYVTGGEDAVAEYITTGHGAYLQDVAQTGSWDTKDISNYRKYGIAESMPVWTYNQENGYLNAKTFYDAMQQTKWIAEFALAEWATGGVGGVLKSGTNAATRTVKAAATAGKGYTASKNIIKGVNTVSKVSDGIGKITKHAAVAYPMSVQEGVSAGRETYKYALQSFEYAADEYAKNKTEEYLISNSDAVEQEALRLIQEDAEKYGVGVENFKIDKYLEIARQNIEESMYNKYKSEYKNSNYKRFEEATNSAVGASFKTTFALSTVKTAVTNQAFRSLVFKKAPTYKFGSSEIKSKLKLNKEGKVEVNKGNSNLGKLKYVKPIVSNMAVEGIDEGFDGIISSFGIGVGDEVYNKHYNNDFENNDFDTYMSYIHSGLDSVNEALHGEDIYREAWMGFLSGGIMIAPNIKGIKTAVTGKNKNGKEYTKFEKLSQFVINPIINDIALNQRQEIEAQKEADIYNKILEGHQDSYKSMNNVIKAFSNVEKLYKNGTQTQIKQAESELQFHMMKLLQELELDGVVGDSEIVKNSLKVLEDAASGNITDEEIEEYINSLSEEEKEITSKEDVKKEIQDRAKKLLDTKKEIEKISKEMNSISSFKRLNKDLKDTIIKNEFDLINWKREIDKLASKLGIISDRADSPIFGGKKDLDARIVEYERTIKDITNTLNKLEEQKNSNKKTSREEKLALKQRIFELKYSLKSMNRELSSLKNKKSNLKEDFSETITVKQMRFLDAESLFYLLNEKNKKFFSKEQLDEIDKFLEKERYSEEDINDLEELSNLHQASRMTEQIQSALLRNPEAANAINRNYEDINRSRIFSMMDSTFLGLDGSRILTDEQIIKEFYVYDPKLLKDYINSRKDTLDKGSLDALNKALSKANLLPEVESFLDALSISNHDKLELLNFILEILEQNDITSSKDLYKKIKEAAGNYKGSINKSVLDSIIDIIDKTESNNEIKEKINTPIIPDSSKPQADLSKPIEPEVKLTPEEEKKIAPEVPKVKPEDIQRGDINPNAESELIAFALNLASKGINGYTKETRNRVVGIINNASPYYTKEELSEYLLAEANRLDTQSSNEDDMMASSLLRRCASKVSNRKYSTNDSTRERGTYTPNIFDRTAPRASGMQSLNMEQVTKKYPNSPNAKLYEKYRVREFLESGQITNKTTVVFISDPAFIKEVEDNMTSNEANVTVYSLPLIAAVEVESGGIEIDGKHYQPIAIMPSTGSQTRRGAARLGDIRTRAYRQKDSGKVELVKDEDGIVITTTISGNINAAPPRQLEMHEPNRSAQTLLINDASESDRRELQNLSKADRKRNPIYQKLKSAFLSRLSHRKVREREELVYKVPNLKRHTEEGEFEEIPIIALLTPSYKTVDRNSDRLIVDLLKEDNKDALYSNSRIIRYTKALNKFFSETFNTSEFSFEQDENGNVIPTESTIKQLREYATQLDSKLGNFLNIPSREGWKYQIESTGNVVDGKVEYKLSIQDSYGNTIDLATLTEGRVNEDTQLEIIRNLMIDSNTGEARMRNNRDGFVIWNVVFADAGSSSEGAKNNMADIFDDDIIEFSKESLKYTVEGVTINAPFSDEGQPLYKEDNTRNSIESRPAAEETVETVVTITEPTEVITEKGNTVDTNTGAIIDAKVQTESTQEQQPKVESTPVEVHTPGRVRNRFDDSIDHKIQEKSIPVKHQWGVFEGAKMSVDEITDALFDQDILTEEDWNNLSEQEKDRILKCLGAL